MRMKKKWPIFMGIVMLAGMGLTGCALFKDRFVFPEIRLVDIEIKEAHLIETVFVIDLRIINPNDHHLSIQGIVCDLALNGRAFATGVLNKKIDIPALGTQIVSLTVYTSILEIAGQLMKLAHQIKKKNPADHVAYRLKGHLHMGDAGSVPARIPFKIRGKLPLEKISGLLEQL
jgi:LEA14-like dessication related protein